MKPAEFDYFAPTTVEEAVSLLAEHGDHAKIIAGGQSLIPLLNFRLACPRILIDINRIESLSYITESGEGLCIGALTRHRTIEHSPLVQAKCPVLSYAARFIGHLAIRNRGTFGGSLAHADPAAEFPLVVAALGGRTLVRGASGERVLDPEEFFVSYLTTALEPSELLIQAWVPTLAERTGWGFREQALLEGTFALVAVCALITLDHQGVCSDARIALGGAVPAPVRAIKAEECLQGERPTEKLLSEAARHVALVAEPVSDVHASSEYRRAMAEVYARRALKDAYARACRAR